ncbi:hypothetical protein SAMN03159371_03666 [Variovorax sp. NFACC28]|nr:hypothetical protein SAMN03159371_03666 [Variovorax sp. NFACC28]SEG77880.1 hypothetical protein SAMN03159365_03745 [Variovorax sp. NFACC29]SFC96598.1 hypothetical protein SAMN03159379_03677 [Variovorax sp. NFACC26]SFG09593.1 hypothetical protein SAMN03159447_01786 [Variovorax sp. NFACC27]
MNRARLRLALADPHMVVTAACALAGLFVIALLIYERIAS